jgi:hypothetical protein
MEDMSCPACQETMRSSAVGDVEIARCEGCRGIFLPRNALGALTEAELDFHTGSGWATAPLPRITADMTAPPPTPSGPRAYIASLFG